MSQKDLQYSHEQKHMLLFRKSEILKYKVLVTNMPHPVLQRHTYPVLERPILF